MGFVSGQAVRSTPAVPVQPLLKNRRLLPSSAQQRHLHLRGSPFSAGMGSDFMISPFAGQCKSVTHDLRERVENNLNNTVSPQGQLPRLDWTRLRVLARTSLFWSNMLLHPILHPDPRTLVRQAQAQLLGHMAKRNLGKQMLISITFKNPIKYNNYNDNSFTYLQLTL